MNHEKGPRPKGMPALRSFAALALLCSATWVANAESPAAPLPDVAEIIAKVRGADSRSFTARARVETASQNGEDSTKAQVLLKGRRTAARTDFLIVALWPAARKGEGLLLRREGGGDFTGFVLEPGGGMHPLGSGGLREPLFGTRLTAETFAEPIWEWPSHKVVGIESVGREECYLVESREKPGAKEFVRTWISREKWTPVRVAVFSGTKLDREIRFERLLRRPGGHYVPAEIEMIEMTDDGSPGRKTTIDFSRGDSDPDLSDDDFTPEAVAALFRNQRP